MHNKAVNADAFFVRCAHYKCAGYGRRSSARSADERARVESSFEFSALRAVELSFERHPFGATSSSRTRVPAAHHDGWNLAVPPPGGRSAPCGMTLNSRPLGSTSENLRR